MLRAPEGDEPAGGGGTPPPGDTPPAGEAKFTQEQVDRIVAARLAKAKLEGKGAAGEVAAAKARLAELEAEAEELRGKVNPTEAEKVAAAKLERENARLRAEVAEAQRLKGETETKLSELSTKQKNTEISGVVRKALAAGGAHTQGLEQAILLMSAEGAAELDDAGVTVTIAGVPYTGEDAIKKAAGAWLAANPHFAKSPDGGSGGRRPNGAALPADMDKMPARQMLSVGLRQNRT